MARKLRVQYEGAIYHVIIRGLERRAIFKDDEDRLRFLMRLGEAVEEYGARVYLFCLMRNHAHLLAETPRANLSVFMHQLQTAYTVYFNHRHQRAGHLMQGRFGAKPVYGDEYVLKLSRYIHLNPVFVGEVRKQPMEARRKSLRAYRWSSYQGYAGLGKPFGFVEEGPILAMMEGPVKRQRVAYRRFVEVGMTRTDQEFLEGLKASPWGIGNREFQERIRDLHMEWIGKVRRKEDVSFRRRAPRIGADPVLRAVAQVYNLDVPSLRKRQYDCVARAIAALLLGREVGMNQRNIATMLGMGTGSAVCRQLKRLRLRMGNESHIAAKVEEIVRQVTA
jgi:putative transposase